jgi:hypothetical protein
VASKPEIEECIGAPDLKGGEPNIQHPDFNTRLPTLGAMPITSFEVEG